MITAVSFANPQSHKRISNLKQSSNKGNALQVTNHDISFKKVTYPYFANTVIGAVLTALMGASAYVLEFGGKLPWLDGHTGGNHPVSLLLGLLTIAGAIKTYNTARHRIL